MGGSLTYGEFVQGNMGIIKRLQRGAVDELDLVSWTEDSRQYSDFELQKTYVDRTFTKNETTITLRFVRPHLQDYLQYQGLAR